MYDLDKQAVPTATRSQREDDEQDGVRYNDEGNSTAIAGLPGNVDWLEPDVFNAIISPRWQAVLDGHSNEAEQQSLVGLTHLSSASLSSASSGALQQLASTNHLPTFASEQTSTAGPSSSTDQDRRKRRKHLASDPQGFQIRDEEARAAVLSLKEHLPFDHPLSLLDEGMAQANVNHCFLLSPLGSQPRSYLGTKLPLDFFRIALVSPNSRHDGEHASNQGRLCRLPGRSVHLVVSALPWLKEGSSLDSGFSLLFVCRRAVGGWQVKSMVSFEKQQKQEGRAKRTAKQWTEFCFRGNVEHCVDEASGRRLWGLRTSHVNNVGKEVQKAIRLQPRRNIGTREPVEICIVAALFTIHGELLYHQDGTPCVTQSNSAIYQMQTRQNDAQISQKGKDVAPVDAQESLIQKLINLSHEERFELSNIPTLSHSVRTLIASSDVATRIRVGQINIDPATAPSTAVVLTSMLKNDPQSGPTTSEHLTPAYKRRCKAVARSIGWYGADAELTDPSSRCLYSLSSSGANGRFEEIREDGLEEAKRWLKEVGVQDIEITAIHARSQMAESLMSDRRFRSNWTLLMTNIYPDRIWVDIEDEDKVYSLADSITEADICLRDRLSALTRFAYCSKLPHHELLEFILQPYIDGFTSRFHDVRTDSSATTLRDSYTAGGPFHGAVLDEEKFFILLHAIHLDYFLYWTRFRNPVSVRRIAERLLQEDTNFAPWWFEPGRFVPFKRT